MEWVDEDWVASAGLACDDVIFGLWKKCTDLFSLEGVAGIIFWTCNLHFFGGCGDVVDSSCLDFLSKWTDGSEKKSSNPVGSRICTLLCWRDDALRVPNEEGSFAGRSGMTSKSNIASSSSVETKLEQST